MSQKRITKSFRLTEEELEYLNGLAVRYDMKISECLRMCINKRPIDNPEFRIMLSALTYEVNKIGTNINQIAYSSNAGIMTIRDKQLLFELMKDIKNKLMEIYDYGNNHIDEYKGRT